MGAEHLQSAPDACSQTKEFLLAAIVSCSFPVLVGREKTKGNSSQGLCALSAGLIFIIVPGTPAGAKCSRAVIRSAASLFWRSEKNICTCCSGFCQDCLCAGRLLQKQLTTVNSSMFSWSDLKWEVQQHRLTEQLGRCSSLQQTGGKIEARSLISLMQNIGSQGIPEAKWNTELKKKKNRQDNPEGKGNRRMKFNHLSTASHTCRDCAPEGILSAETDWGRQGVGHLQ